MDILITFRKLFLSKYNNTRHYISLLLLWIYRDMSNKSCKASFQGNALPELLPNLGLTEDIRFLTRYVGEY